MRVQMRPLLSFFEQELPEHETASGRDPRGELTSLDVIYKSTLLDPDAFFAGLPSISKYTKVAAETTDDE